MGYWVDDPNGGAPQYHEGFDPAQGQSVEGPGVHTSKKKLLWQQGKYFLVPLSLGIADAALGAQGAAQALGVSPMGATTGGTTIGLTAPSAAAATGAPLTAAVTGAGTAAGATTAAAAGTGTGAGTVAGTAGATGLGSRLLNGALNRAPGLLDLGARAFNNAGAQDAVNAANANKNNSDFNTDLINSTKVQNDTLDLDLRRREFQGKDYQRNFTNAARGDMLANMQDVNVQAPPGIPMGHISGGLSWDALPNRGTLGKTVQQQAMDNLLHPQEMPPLPGAPDLTAPKNPGENGNPVPGSTQGKIGLGLNIGSQLLSGYLNSRTPRPSTTPNVPVASVNPAQIYAPSTNYDEFGNPTGQGFMGRNASFLRR